MKILHCLSQLPNKTGSGIFFTNIFLECQRHGFTGAVLYARQPALYAEVPQAFTSVPNFTVEFETPALPFPIAGMSDVMPYPSTVYAAMTEKMFTQWITAFTDKLYEAKKAFNPDVIITHHFFILTALVNKIFADKKIIACGHGTDMRQLEQNPWIRENYISGFDNVYRFCLVTPKDRETLQKKFHIDAEKISVVGGGYDAEIFNRKNTQRCRLPIKIVYAGKIAKAKGVFELAQAARRILQQFPHVEFTVIGSADTDTKEKLQKVSGNPSRFKMLPPMSQQELARIYRSSHIFVLPSYYEALGLSVIEALACGMYAVTTEIRGLQYLLTSEAERCGAIEYVKLPKLQNVDEPVPAEIPAFVERLTEKIVRQIERVTDQSEPDKTIFTVIQNFTWNHIAEKIIALF